MDEGRDNLVSIAAMDQIEELTIEEIQRRDEMIREADLLVLDVNLAQDTLDFVCGYAQDIYIDCISSRKAMKLKTLLPKIHSIKMSLLEAELFTGITYRNPDDLDSMSRQLQQEGVREVFITLGEQGAYHSHDGKASFIKAASVEVVNTTGAGDAFFAGAIYAKLNGLPPLPYATVNALINLRDEKAVSSLLTRELLEDTVRENKYQRG
jgi:pseudouridine kinase